MKGLYSEANKAGKNAIAEDSNWLTGVTGIVADNRDDERQHRVKVIIPSIDEDLIYDEWARQMVFCLGDGFGSAFIPPVGSEVVLFGQLGGKFNLFYAALYNEEMMMPTGYDDETTVGVHAPKDLKFTAEELLKLQAKNIEVIAAQVAKILAQDIEFTAQQAAAMKGNNATVEAAATALLKGNQVNINGSTITVQSDGSISISGGGAVSISGASVTIENRLVKKVGPAI